MRVSTLQSMAAREVLPRIFVDTASLCASVLLASFTYLLGWIVLWRNYPDPRQVRDSLSAIYFQNVFTLALIGITVFALSGFYTHARGYRGRFKLLVIFNAVSITYLLQSFVQYAFLRLPLPRAVVVLAWLISLGLIGSSRIFKGYVTRNYHIERKVIRGTKPVKSVLVIGGAGYIGSVLVRRLMESGFQVRVLDELLFGEHSLASLRANPGFELLRADFRHVESVVRGVQGMDAVIHLGAIVGDPACKLDSKTTLETNLAATLMIKNVCLGAGIRRFLFASTCSVYGASPYLLDERSAPDPLSLYACTKLDSERVILEHHAADYVPTILRLGTAFGWSYRPRFDLVVNLLTARAICEHRLTIFNQAQWRPFIHVEDIGRAFIACLRATTSQVAYEVFNVGCERLNATLGDLARQVQEQVPSVEVEYVENGDHRNYRVSFEKVSAVLEFDCLRTLQDGIGEIKKAFESGMVVDYHDPRYHNDRTLERLNTQTARQEPELLVGASEKFLRHASAAIG